jgi:phosphate transport system substrate-binding protein
MNSKIIFLICALLSTQLRAELQYIGSDTVQPIISAAEQAYIKDQSDFKVNYNTSGSSVGYRSLCFGMAYFVGGSRAIKSSESAKCNELEVYPLEIPVAYDSLAIVTSSENTWLKTVTFEELKAMFGYRLRGGIYHWDSLDKSFPHTYLKPVGVGPSHGTFGFFTNSLGRNFVIKPNYRSTRTHQLTVEKLISDVNAIGFIPTSLIHKYEAHIKTIGVDFGKGVVYPDDDSLRQGKYSILSRILYLSINPVEFKKDQAGQNFLLFMLDGMDRYASESYMVPLSSLQYQESIRRVQNAMQN